MPFSDPNCQVIACDVTNKYEEFARRFWKKAGVEDKIQLKVAPGKIPRVYLGNNNYSNKFNKETLGFIMYVI